MRLRNIAGTVVLALVLLPVLAWGQQKGSIQLKSVSEVEVVEKNAKGERVVRREDTATAKVVPGSTVVFTTTYTNIGDKPATGVVVTNPVPEHMTYVALSAEGKGAKIEFSVDGGKTYAAPDKLTKKDAQGRVLKAGAKEYTHIKWTLIKSLPAGGAGSVGFRATVN